jgi:hypothetical protein
MIFEGTQRNAHAVSRLSLYIKVNAQNAEHPGEHLANVLLKGFSI